MQTILSILTPELLLTITACILFLLGCSKQRLARLVAPVLALGCLAILAYLGWSANKIKSDSSSAIFVDRISTFIRFLTPLVGIMLLLLAWPSNYSATGNSALEFGMDAGEFFGLFLLSLAGLMLISVANDLVILFLALELVSIPTYIMVSISRKQTVAQEAAVKYFFLGALSVALMLFGFSYLYGTTGQINFSAVTNSLHKAVVANGGQMPAWPKLGILLVIAGLAFKMAAFPLHFYAGDVYEGAATPVTAFLAFVPKTAGFVALLRILSIAGGENFVLPAQLVGVLAGMATMTMTIGNVLGLMQSSVKRVLAYSSVAHSGYMLVGVAALAGSGGKAMDGVLLYIGAYGLMNAAAFGVLMLVPSGSGEGAAETFEDLAGQGRKHVILGLAMTISCFSLIGMPLTVGFSGKLLLIQPALSGNLTWLAIVLLINAAISAAYYLRIVATMFLRTESEATTSHGHPVTPRQWGIMAAVGISVFAIITCGTIPAVADGLAEKAGIDLPGKQMREKEDSSRK